MTGAWANGDAYTEADAFDAFSELIYAHLNWHHVSSAWTPQRIDARIDARVLPEVIDGNAVALGEAKVGLWTGTAAEYALLTPAQRSAYHLLAVSG